MMAVPFLRGGWISAYQVSFNYFRKWIYAWNGALSPSASVSEVIVPALPYRFATLHIFPLPSFSFFPFFFFISRGNISWKSGNNLLSLPPVIYRPPLFRNVPDRISPFNLPAFIPRYRAPVYASRFHRHEISTIGKVTRSPRMCVEKKRERRKEKDRVRSLGVKRGVKGGKFSKNEKIENEGEREREARY